MKTIITLIIGCACVFQAYAEPVNLRCEHLTNPLGIDAYSPRLSWQLNDPRYGAQQTAYQITVGTDSAAVAAGRGNVWNSPRTNSGTMLIKYEGDRLQPFARYFWRVAVWDKDNAESVSHVAAFETGMMEMSNWKGSWISDGVLKNGNGVDVKPAPYFRKEFDAKKKIRSARAYIAVGGLYELYVNGERIGNHRLDPMYTRFDRRNLYVAHDVTRQLQEGKNAVGVLLGNGWYNHQSVAVWFFDNAPWRARPAFCLDLRIVYDDGTTETIVSERDWKTSLSPVIFNSIYTAEHYDARLEQEGWNRVGFDASKWKETYYRSAPSNLIVAQQLHPIRNVEQISAMDFEKINDTTFIYNLGRNISGVSELRVKGEAGTEIRLQHAEICRPDKSLYMRNIDEHYRPKDNTDPFQTDIFILAGKGEEVFMPRFNYKGFQYVKITSNKPLTLSKDALTGWFMHSDVPPVGRVETSNPLVNKIWQATNNSYLSNLFGYPTDCPQREKNGWTGDAQIAIETGLYNFDGITVYEKWMADHRDEQQPNGVFPNIIPTSGCGYDWANGLDWTSTIAIIPWQIYMFYGDSQLLADCYDNIKRYLDHVDYLYPSGLTKWGLGDWIPVKSQTPVEFTSTLYYYTDAMILSRAAKLFGKEEDAVHYAALAEKIKTAFNNKYLDKNGYMYDKGFQTELSAALHWQIVHEELKTGVAANLAKRVEADNRHIDVGLLGSKTILNALSDNGYADLAFTLASQDTYPSWGHWIKHDQATTLYEAWQAIGEGKEASLNHIMFGEIGAWLYKALGGIHPDPANPGFANILLKPHFVKDLTYATVNFQSPYGEIVSKWERKKKDVIYKVTVPANAKATLYVPANYQLGKVKLSAGEVISLPETEKGAYSLVAGSYEMEFKSQKMK
ncbi:MAG: glycoside hydrolase family 78 protein [Prevotellaceae bacterium]|jgi:alpha-L-rhamnosidase|nr:glycoside hydrolase family 78 protein [Prevotellaceae bacterium]